MPVVEYYQKFGKVHKIDATGDVSTVYAATKKAVIPQVMFIVGPKTSGKTTICDSLAPRTNMLHMNFSDFVASNGLEEEDDETIVMSLISNLSQCLTQRVVLEGFPQNTLQAKFFLRNCKAPSDVFMLECSKDICQERMQEMGENSKGYVSSSILSQRIKEYYESAKDLVPFLKSNTNCLSVNTD